MWLLLFSQIAFAQFCPMSGPLTEVGEKLACMPLPEKSSMIVDQEDSSSLTGVQKKYRLTRTGPKSFRVDLRMQFIPDEDYDQFLKEPEYVNKRFQDEVSRCLKSASPYLKGPDGQILELALTQDKEVPLNTVWIKNIKYRNHDDKYSSLIDCPTKIHEVLHLTGLVDEYVEGAGDIYKCRAIGPPNSIMHYQNSATQDAIPSSEYQYDVCICNTTENNCLAVIANANSKESEWTECPKEYDRRTSKGVFPFDYPPESHQSISAVILKSTIKKIKDIKTKQNSLLLPAQFRYITKPLCQSENYNYLFCARNAYATQGCDSPPKECQGKDWLK